MADIQSTVMMMQNKIQHENTRTGLGRRWCIVLLTLVITWCCQQAVRGADALEGDQDRFPQNLQVGDTALYRAGVGRMRRWMITGADVALYVPKGTKRNEILDGRPLAVSFYYYVRIRGEQFTEAGVETLQENVDDAVLEKQSSNIEKMGSWLTDVGRGDRYLLTYAPEIGTTLKRNGKKLGIIEGADFAAVYFQIWLGENPIDERMYNALVAALPD